MWEKLGSSMGMGFWSLCFGPPHLELLVFQLNVQLSKSPTYELLMNLQ